MPRRLLIVALLALALAAGARVGEVGRDDDDGAATLAGRVVRVVDGDTIRVAIDGREETVRYIGVDTPETRHPRKGRQCFGRAASAYNARLVDAEPVRLAGDVQERDRYGRRLAYVYRIRDGLFVNAELARRGYAQPLTIPPNVRFSRRFAALARAARAAGRGLWAAC